MKVLRERVLKIVVVLFIGSVFLLVGVAPVLSAQPQITGYREKCATKGKNVTILGKNFGTQAGKAVALGKVGTHVSLSVVSWSNNMIVAKIPNTTSITAGQSYYIGIETSDHVKWLSNIDKYIRICSPGK